MTKMNFDQPFSHALVPVKTLWFEFLLDSNLLDKHLENRYADPSAIELIALFLNNAVTLSGSSSVEDLVQLPNNNNGNNNNVNNNNNNSVNNNNTTSHTITNNLISNNGNGLNHDQVPNPLLIQPEARLDTNSNGSNGSANSQSSVNNKKCFGLKLLAVKVAAYLNFDLPTIEKHLPVNMQFMLLNELIKICEQNNGHKCSLFAYINYYRWILRSVIRITYPSRKSQVVPIPLLQQIDPCYLPTEALESWGRKLKELASVAVNGLEKVIKENEVEEITNIIRPRFECLKQLAENSNEPSFDWQQVQLLDTTEVMDTIKYELGKWFFFNQQYEKSNEYFAKVSCKYESQFKHLNDYKYSSAKMASKYTKGSIDASLEIQLKECLDLIEQGEANHFYELQSKLDPNYVKQEIRNRFAALSIDSEKANRLKQTVCYLSCKNKQFKNFWYELSTESRKTKVEPPTSKLNGISKPPKPDDAKSVEIQLLQSTEPEFILEASTKVKKNALQINCKWILPAIHASCLEKESMLSQFQRNQIHIVLAKAFELRKAKLYSTSRTLFLSLLEDIQTNLPELAEVITYELLQTDLEIQSQNPNPTKDIRRSNELSNRCEAALAKEQIVNNISPDLLCYASLLLLEREHSLLNHYLHNSNALLKLSALLHTLGTSNRTSCSIELWDLLLGSLSNAAISGGGTILMNKRRQQLQFPTVVLSLNQLTLFLQNIRAIKYVCILISVFARMHNLVRDNQQLELTLPSSLSIQWPNSVGANGMLIDLKRVSTFLKILLAKALEQQPNELQWLKVKAELALMEGKYDQALCSLLHMLIVKSSYFTRFEGSPDEEYLIQKMIVCSMKLFCYTQAVILHQMCREINYSLVFKALAEKHCFDSCDDLYECIWDVTILEYLIHLHHKRGEVDRKTKIVRLIGQLELNANNAEHIRQQAAYVRRGRFFRYMAKKYL